MRTASMANRIPRFRRVVWMAALLATGCVATGTHRGIDSVSFDRGDLESELQADFDQTVRAVDRAVHALQYARVSEERTDSAATEVVRSRDQRRVEIRIERSGGGHSAIRIRVGILGDELESRTVLNEVVAAL